MAKSLPTLAQQIIACNQCPRLRAYCREIGIKKRKSYRDHDYWAKPVPDFGSAPAPILIVGLAPGAHGANRTGRMFTGDRSGLWLYRALHRAGLARAPSWEHAGDGQSLVNCAITAVCHCAPPDNRPTSTEIRNCSEWLEQTIQRVQPTLFLAMGQIAWNAVHQFARRRRWHPGPRPSFGHGRIVPLTERRFILGCFHPSQQNTFTGRLTESMLDEIMELAKRQAAIPGS